MLCSSQKKVTIFKTGAYLGGFPGVPETLIFWLEIETTIDHHFGTHKSMKQQTILCLVAHKMNVYRAKCWQMLTYINT